MSRAESTFKSACPALRPASAAAHCVDHGKGRVRVFGKDATNRGGVVGPGFEAERQVVVAAVERVWETATHLSVDRERVALFCSSVMGAGAGT